MPSRPCLVGLVGGIASGKSTVARAFARHGARTIDADAIAKEILDLPEVRRALAAAFGDVETAGRVDHRKLAEKAFGSEPAAARLNALVHPSVTAEIDRRVAAWTAEGFRGPVVVDAALLLEAGMKGKMDALVYVEAPEGVRRERAKARGWAEDELKRRERLQWPLEEKRRACGHVVANGGTVEEMEGQVAALVARLCPVPKGET
ncbi:MAG: dephospho-CoA kinase [Planctomycetes bacterium]|nr:dephospho-CoA kinase [Planctomycetota bacterium]